MKKACFSIVMILVAGAAFAQDIHFTQFYASPLTLNPALTGKMNGDYRLAAIYRAQWKSLTSDPSFNAYATPAASFDMPFIFGKKKNNAIGAGILLANDITNHKRLNTLYGLVSVAYHKILDKEFRHQLSIGVQGGIQQTNAKISEFTFQDQYDANGNLTGDPSVDANRLDDSKTIPEINTGLFYSGRVVNKLTVFAGFSIFNIGEPKKNLSTQEDNSQLPMRYVVHGGLDWSITERLSLLPGVIYMAQAEAREINFGTNFAIDLSQEPGKEATLYVGAWYRWDDAVSPMLGFELMRRFRMGFSYDVTTSSLSDGNNNKGGFEISLIYVGQILRMNEANLFCPRY